MKISAHHKSRGDKVKLIDDFYERFDVAYISKTFNLPHNKKIPQLTQMPLADEIYLGGTGFAIEDIDGKERYHKNKDPDLPHDIEHIMPDFGLYSDLTRNTAFGFLTRGCPNACGFCILNGKEGKQSVQVADLSEFWNGQRSITIMDANLLACDNVEGLIKSLAESKASVDFTQGLDARYVDEDTARLLCRVNIKMAHFAFDLMCNETEIIRGLTFFRKYFNKSDRQCRVYILTNYNTTHAEDWYRVQKVIELGYSPDVRIYRKGTHSQFLTDLAGWSNNIRIYRSTSFADFIPRKDGKRCGELYKSILSEGRI
jgi:hypothetical protein